MKRFRKSFSKQRAYSTLMPTNDSWQMKRFRKSFSKHQHKSDNANQVCWQMKKTILIIAISMILLITAFAQNEQCSQDYIALEFQYKNNSFQLVGGEIGKGCIPQPKHNLSLQYSYEILSKEKQLETQTISPLILYSDAFELNETSGSVQELEEANFWILTPKYDEAEKIKLYKEGKQVYEKEVYNVGAVSCRV